MARRAVFKRTRKDIFLTFFNLSSLSQSVVGLIRNGGLIAGPLTEQLEEVQFFRHQSGVHESR
jgi:hypothetical protein